MIFDLDPSDNGFEKVRHAARSVKALLDELELYSFVQTTGSRGLHIVVPLDRTRDFDTVRAFTHRCCRTLANAEPDRLTTEQRKHKRGNRLFLDFLRNAYGQTAVSPYAVRARRGAPVATPLQWNEVWHKPLHPQRYHIDNLFRRLGQTEDPWANISRHAHALPDPECLQ